MAGSVGLLKELENVQGQLSLSQEQSSELKNKLEDAETRQASLSQDLETTQSKLAAEEGDSAELRLKLETTEVDLADAQESREQAESDMEELHSLELARVNDSLHSVTNELGARYTANEEKDSELEVVQDTPKQTQLHLRQAETEQVTVRQQLETVQSQLTVEKGLRLKLEAAEVNLKISLEQSRHDTDGLRELHETQTLELASVQESLTQTMHEVQVIGNVNKEQTSQLQRIQHTLERTQLHLQNIEKSRDNLISEVMNAEVNLAQTQNELANSLNVNKDLKQLAVVQAKLKTDEIAVLLDRIDELEAPLPRSYLGMFVPKMRMLAVSVWWRMLSPKLD